MSTVETEPKPSDKYKRICNCGMCRARYQSYFREREKEGLNPPEAQETQENKEMKILEIKPDILAIIDKIVVQNQVIINQNAGIIELLFNPAMVMEPEPLVINERLRGPVRKL